MKASHVHSPQTRLQARQAGELRASRMFLQLIGVVSILRTALTRLAPLAGSSAWWLTLVCLLPGMAVFSVFVLAMRLTGTATLADCLRRCFGRLGAWLHAGLLGAALLLDGTASMTALITVFTEGIGTRGTQLTLAILTGTVLLFSLHREGLPRAAYALRWVMLAAALLTAAFTLPQLRPDGLYPMTGGGLPSLWTAFSAGVSLAWPLLLLLTLPPEEGCPRAAALCPVVLSVAVVLLFVTLMLPHELLTAGRQLADSLLLPTRYAPSALRTLSQCLLMLVFFLAVGGAVQLAVGFLCAPAGRTPIWLPHAVLILLTLTQALDVSRLWAALECIGPWLLLPFAVLACAALPISILRR